MNFFRYNYYEMSKLAKQVKRMKQATQGLTKYYDILLYCAFKLLQKKNMRI